MDDLFRSAKQYKRRTITIRPQTQHEALQAARRRQKTPAFARRYALREGIEATISQGVRAFGMRRSRYIGFAKTHYWLLSLIAGDRKVKGTPGSTESCLSLVYESTVRFGRTN